MKIPAAGVRDLDHFQSSLPGVHKHHGYFLIGGEWEGLLEKKRPHSSGAGYGYGVEAVGNLLIQGIVAKAKTGTVGNAVDGKVYRKMIGGCI